jgi:coenzyme Q-binding protein COQ10
VPSVIKKQRSTISPSLAFASVKDFKSYPEFLPWCSGARLQSSRMLDDNTEEFIADLIIKYKFFTEVFTTKVTCNADNHHIDIDYVKGAFKHLKSYWRFYPVPDNPNATDIEFMIDFSMKFSPFQKIMEIFFEEAMKKMIIAFDERFKKILVE